MDKLRLHLTSINTKNIFYFKRNCTTNIKKQKSWSRKLQKKANQYYIHSSIFKSYQHLQTLKINKNVTIYYILLQPLGMFKSSHYK